MGMKEDGPKRPNKKLLYYYGIILLITILLNALVMPALAERSVTEVTYDQFLDMLDNKQIAGVTRGDNQLTFWTGGCAAGTEWPASVKILGKRQISSFIRPAYGRMKI